MPELDRYLSLLREKMQRELRKAGLEEELDDAWFDALLQATQIITLRDGQHLLYEGEEGSKLYVAVEGTLLSYRKLPSGQLLNLRKLRPGMMIGDMQFFLGGRAQASVVATSVCVLAQISRAQFEELVTQAPVLARHLSLMVQQRIQGSQIATLLAEHLGDASPQLVQNFLEGATWVRLLSGEPLFAMGDEADSLYLVMSGRLNVVIPDGRGGHQIFYQVAQGDIVGELSLFAGTPRRASVFAQRDSMLVRYTREGFESLVQRYPKILTLLVGRLAERITPRARRTKGQRYRTKHIALVPLHEDVPIDSFGMLLQRELESMGPTTTLSPKKIEKQMNVSAEDFLTSGTPQAMWLDLWLEKQDTDHRFVLLEATPHLSIWTKKCLRHADLVLLVSWANGSPSLTRLEMELQSTSELFSANRQELVLLHPANTLLPSGTLNWLEPRDVRTHHHVRWALSSDMARVARLVADKGIGLVLGGGGARGAAHIGIIRAMQELGVPIDFVGGTSAGALVGAQAAMGFSAPQILSQNQLILDKRKPFRAFTLPIFGMLSDRRIEKSLDELFGDVRIEDLWTNYFCVSVDLKHGNKVIHRRGLLQHAIQASSAVPGLMPPKLDNGTMLADGAVLDNLPGEVMRNLNSGPLIVVDIGDLESFSVDASFQKLPSPWEVLWSWLWPWKPAIRLPSLNVILLQSSMISSISKRKEEVERADLFLHPPLDGFYFLDFHKLQGIEEAGYHYGLEKFQSWQPGDIARSLDELEAVRVE
ncbi:MAG: cyclic nucleotide-binding domain-containing protein [Deltaproteobacteria bacterium]|nr:MAG: cyclic nucleotide-binding domain-containing protein [Deltaproteobacteria bacterium]